MSAEPTLDVIAGEYVLGLMSPDEERDLEARLAGDAALKAAVREARERFLELDLTTDAGEPPAAVWDKINAQITGTAGTHSGHATVVPFAPKSASSKTAGFWQGFGAASLAASVIAGVGTAALWPTLRAPAPTVVVVLLDAQAKPGAIIEAFADDSVRVVPLENFTVPEGRVIQLWTLPDAKTGPVSIGLLPGVHETKLVGPSLPKPKPDQLYEFTLEPAGGSPTGKPTGPILVKGFAKQPI
ncbi:MAG: anti-sigma factor [Hyphomicrobiaceae bacterium]